MKHSTKWYKEQTVKLKRILHEVKYEFDPSYKRMYDMLQRAEKDIDRAIWSGFSMSGVEVRYDGFVNLIECK